MTRAQDLYNEFLALGWKCRWCGDKHFKFSQVTSWGEGGANVNCPFCDMALRIDQPDVVKKIEQLGDLDKKVIKLLVEYADRGGQFDEHSPYNKIYLKCMMVIKHSPQFKSLISYRPLPYIERMVMIQIYRELVEKGNINEIEVYEVKAPIPVEIERSKVKGITHSGKAPKAKKPRKYKEVKKKAAQLNFTIGGSVQKQVAKELSIPTPEEEYDLDAGLAEMLGTKNNNTDTYKEVKKENLESAKTQDLSDLDEMMKNL